MMASGGMMQAAMLLLAAQLVLCRGGAADVDREPGTVIPAESRPCVDCHAFEFMQRALQDLKKTAFNLDARVPTRPQQCVKRKNGDHSWAKNEKTETLVLRAERRALCDCMPSSLR